MSHPDTMQAVLLTGHGGLDRLKVRTDVAVPEPRAGEVLVRVGASAINNTDINTRIAWYSKAVTEGTTGEGGAAGFSGADDGDASWAGSALSFPRIQGIDVCGRIEAVGEGVARERIGERVLVEPCLREPVGWAPYRCWFLGSECDGGFADYVAVPAVHAYRIDSPLSDVELASFPCAWSTAENMLTRAGLQAGERVLVTGASGGVGSAAVQLAARRGAEVLAVTGRAKADAVRALGAARLFERDADLAGVLGPESVDVVVDLVGGPVWPHVPTILRRGGRYAVAGAIGGPLVEMDIRTLYLKDLSLHGCAVLEREVFANLVGYIERGEVRPLVAETYPLSEIVTAQEVFLAKGYVGKIVLVPDALYA
ncbi:alcohol dehydrogenase family protein [Kaustia mangrovi]|nr:alcohol dehydrogenase family protein [Kaustia mangrovi]